MSLSIRNETIQNNQNLHHTNTFNKHLNNTHTSTNPTANKDPYPTEVIPEWLRVNLTETIPKDYMYTNTPETPQQLQFKNIVLELTTTRKMTMSITSDGTEKHLL